MLQALMEYGARLDSEPGFKTREVRWLVKLDQQGKLLGVLPLGDGKRGLGRVNTIGDRRRSTRS